MTSGRRCLVVHPGAVGDVLLGLPALVHLARLVPGAQRVLAVTPRIGALLADSTHAEETLDFEDLRLHRLFMPEPDPEVLSVLGTYEVIVSWFGSADATYRRNLARLPGRTIVAPARPAAGTHASRHLLGTLTGLGPSPETLPGVPLGVPVAARRWAVSWLSDRGLGPGEAIVLHPGAGGRQKIWPGFPALLDRLLAGGEAVVVVVGPADRGVEDWLRAERGFPDARVARDVPLPRLAALFAAARACVGHDSGPSHLAAAVGCPTLALFGPSDPGTWAPIGRAVSVLAGHGPGAPDPWSGLTVDRVLEGLATLVESARGRPTVAAGRR